METVDISLPSLGLLYLFLLLPLLLIYVLRISLKRELLLAAFRMTLQLTLVGLYLRYLFESNSLLLNLLWLAAMLVVAASHTVKKSGLRRRGMLLPILVGLTTTMGFVLFPFLLIIAGTSSIADARYLIPIAGMIMGNSLTANIIALDNFSSAAREKQYLFRTALCSGATRFEAALPHIRLAFRRAITPQITTIGTIGLVSLPGMMTGQLLGGSFPLVAIKYQIAIMIAIISSVSLSTFLSLHAADRYLFDSRGAVRDELFQNQHKTKGR